MVAWLVALLVSTWERRRDDPMEHSREEQPIWHLLSPTSLTWSHKHTSNIPIGSHPVFHLDPIHPYECH
jgi:hypothetical protein